MKKTLLALASAVTVTAFPVVSHAEDASPLSFNIGAVTDYRYRGISQSRLKPALQGGVDYASPSGFYVGAWGSTIKWIKDAGEIAGVDVGSSNVEIDLYGGYKGEIQKDLTYDVGVLQYVYPGNHYDNLGGGAKKADTTEIYGALTFGPATVKYSHAVSTLFGTFDSKNSGYFDLSATFDAGSGVSIVPHVGYQRVAGDLSDYSYADYSVTASKDFDGFLLSGAIVGTNNKKINGNYAYISPEGKNLGRTMLVVGVKKTF